MNKKQPKFLEQSIARLYEEYMIEEMRMELPLWLVSQTYAYLRSSYKTDQKFGVAYQGHERAFEKLYDNYQRGKKQ